MRTFRHGFAACLAATLLAAPGVHTARADGPASTREPFRYGFISKNVSCSVNGRVTRQRYVSQVFGYCEAEVSKGQLLRDTILDFRRVAGVECEGTYDVTYELVDGPYRSSDDAEQEQARALASRDYSKAVEWYASVDYMSSRCR